MKIDYPQQLQRVPVIDPRAYGARGDGINDDTAAIQAALDAAATGVFSSIVQLTAGRYLVRSALKFKHDGITLQGTGMSGYTSGSGGFTTAVLLADNAHDFSPMIRMSYADAGGTNWIHGCIRNITIDVSSSSVWNTASASPPVIQLSGVSDSPAFENIFVYGHTGTALAIGTSADTMICENLQFNNMMFFGGYNAAGGSLNVQPTADGVVVTGADNCQFRGGMVVFNYIGITVNGNTTDKAAVKLIPSPTTTNLINNGFVMIGTIFTRYACTIRLSALNIGGTWYGPQNVRIIGAMSETYGRFVVVNEETATNMGYWRSQLELSHCFVSGAFGGAQSRMVYANHLHNSFIRLQFLGQTGDLYLGSDTTGVAYEIGANPNDTAGSFYAATDLGSNYGRYIKSGLIGGYLTGQTRLMGTTDPSLANAGSVGSDQEPLQCYGNTVKLWSTGRNPGNSAAAGQLGEVCIANNDLMWHNGTQWLKVTGVAF